MNDDQLRKELYASNTNRGVIYYLIFDELTKEIGPQKAKEILKRAIYRRGEMLGRAYRQFAPDDFQGLSRSFIGSIPDHGAMFSPRVLRCDSTGLDVEFFACPLKSAWQEMGLSEQECAEMCEIAGVIDQGMFEGAGFSFQVEALPQGRSDSCLLRIRPVERSSDSLK